MFSRISIIGSKVLRMPSKMDEKKKGDSCYLVVKYSMSI